MGIHDGHRERMKNRFREHGAEQLEDHQLLESEILLDVEAG